MPVREWTSTTSLPGTLLLGPGTPAEAPVPREVCERQDVPDLPMFPTAAGGTVTKASMTATIVKAAQLLNHPLQSEDGTQRVSGHTLRCTGAQGLAHLGLDTWTI